MKPLNPADYPTYNIGDKVTIRQWDDMESEFGLNRFGSITVPESFTEEMKRYCGKTFTIARIIEEGEYGFPVYLLSGNGYNYTSPMFEQSYPTVVCASTLTFDDLLKGATAQLANPQA